MLQKLKGLFNQTFRQDELKKQKTRFDGFFNPYTNLGGNDRTGKTQPRTPIILSPQILTNLYRDDGIAKRIVDILVEDAIRNFIETEEELLNELSRLKVKQKLSDAGSFGRLYGGAIIVAFIDDGLELDQPVNFNSIQRVASFKIFDKHQISWQKEDLSQNFNSEIFGEPEYFTIHHNRLKSKNSSSFKIHRSRCFLFGGAKLPNAAMTNNDGWDDSVLQACYEALQKYSITTSACSEIIQDFVQVIFKVKELGLKLAGENGWQEVQNRLQIFNDTRSVVGGVLIDADGEDYEKRSSSVAGIDGLWDRYSEFVCAVTGLPATKLFGKSPGGLNSTGDSDMQNHYDNVRAYRANQLEPAINWVIALLKPQKKWLKKPSNFQWEFASLTSPSESEWADIKKKYAEIDAIYANLGAIDPVECWQKRYGKGAFKTNIILSKPDTERIPREIDADLEEILNPKEQKSKSEQKIERVMDAILAKSIGNDE